MQGAARLLALIAGLVLAAQMLPGPAPAQEVPGTGQGAPLQAPGAPDYVGWERAAERAERVLDEDTADDAALELLRADMAAWRAQFDTARRVNDTRIGAVEAQIEALGPAPAEGTSEPEEVAAQRAELTEQLLRLQAPQRTAEAAYSRADALVRDIDARFRERQTDALLRLGPTPLNPALWPVALSALTTSARQIWAETRALWEDEARMRQARDSLPVVALFLVIAAVLLLRGRHWSEALSHRVQPSLSPAAGEALSFVFSLGQLLLPLAGLLALTVALLESGLFGERGSAVVALLPVLGIFLYGALWLAFQIFPKGERGNRVLALPPERRAEGRFFAGLTAVAVWLLLLVRSLAQSEGWSDGVLAVLQLPQMAVIGLCLVRLGQLLGRRRPEEGEEATGWVFRRRLAYFVGRAVVVLGVVGPVLAIIGYQAAAEFLTIPAVGSLALLAFLMVLQNFLTQIYALLTRRTQAELGEALMPVLFGLALAVLSLPVFALIWGVRVADLTEIWTRFRGGFQMGETRISPGMFLTFVVVFAIGFTATRILQGTLKAAVLPKTGMDAGGQNAVVAGLGYLGIGLAALAAITAAGVDLSALALIFGALSVGIGFGLQNIVQNFISGIIMLIERPVAAGDWVEVGGQQGIVRDISVRSTRIETFDKTSVIVPNGEFITGIVTNWTRGSLAGRIIVPVGVAYGTDTRKVEAILREIVEAHPLVILNPPPGVFFTDFGPDALMFEIRAILRDVNFGMGTRSEIRHQIAERFKAEGIEIPFAQRDLWIRNPEALRGGGPARAPGGADTAAGGAGP